MRTVVRMNKWANAHTSIVLDLFRIALGVLLFWKGLEFAGQTDALVKLIQPEDPIPATMIFAHYIAMAHLTGGVLVAFGMITRLALLFQLPILIGAVIINITADLGTWNLVLAVLGLVGGLFFFVIGSGKHSVDYNLKMNM
jgi:putative oxidoreductase